MKPIKIDFRVTLGKYQLGRGTPRHILNKKVLRRFNKRIKTRYEILRMKKIVLNANNYCNLECFSCVSLCDTPMGSNVWRDRPRVMDPEILDRALSELTRYKAYDGVNFAGGEPTAIPVKDLEELASVVRDHGLKVLMLTNGFGVDKLDPWDFDYFTLDDHGINVEAIKRSVAHLNSHGFENYYVHVARIHRNFAKAREIPVITQGLKCPGWMDLTLWLDLVYPCCGMPQLEGWDNDTVIRIALKKAGWTVENPKLSETLENWRETIPGEVIKKCLFSCWRFREVYEERSIEKEYLESRECELNNLVLLGEPYSIARARGVYSASS